MDKCDKAMPQQQQQKLIICKIDIDSKRKELRGKSFIHSQQSSQAIHNTRNSLEFVAFVTVTLAANRNHNNLWAYSQSKRFIVVGSVPASACARMRWRTRMQQIYTYHNDWPQNVQQGCVLVSQSGEMAE